MKKLVGLLCLLTTFHSSLFAANPSDPSEQSPWSKMAARFEAADLPETYEPNSVWSGRCVTMQDAQTLIHGLFYFRRDSDPNLGSFPVFHVLWDAQRDFSQMPLSAIRNNINSTYFFPPERSTLTKDWVVNRPARAWQSEYEERWLEKTYKNGRPQTESKELKRTHFLKAEKSQNKVVFFLKRVTETNEPTLYCYFDNERTKGEEVLTPPPSASGVHWKDRFEQAYAKAVRPTLRFADLKETIWAGYCNHMEDELYQGAIYFSEESEPVLGTEQRMFSLYDPYERPFYNRDYLTRPVEQIFRQIRESLPKQYFTSLIFNGEDRAWEVTYRAPQKLPLKHLLRQGPNNASYFMFKRASQYGTDGYCYFNVNRTAE